jgi:hypothetical protein
MDVRPAFRKFGGGWYSGAEARFIFGAFDGMTESHAPSLFRAKTRVPQAVKSYPFTFPRRERVFPQAVKSCPLPGARRCQYQRRVERTEMQVHSTRV